jgi:hypothetical protein
MMKGNPMIKTEHRKIRKKEMEEEGDKEGERDE